ncbi:MAG: hypothetical protein PHX18_01500 [Candidatus Gastranaerophilales bacterium]|nr:hypothetical protein [Candidatus Gastranaerophilales bacterium]
MNILKANMTTNCTPLRPNFPRRDVAFRGGFYDFARKTVNHGYDKFTDVVAIGVGKAIDTTPVRKFAEKFHTTNLAAYMFALTGVMLSTFQIISIAKSPKIKEERKKPLMLKGLISCVAATVGGFTIDKLLDKPLDKYAKKFAEMHAKNPNLHKYMEGIKIAKSALVFGMLYRFIVPVISTFCAQKIVDKQKA